MDNTVIPYQTSAGMTVIGSFISLDDDDKYIWIRRFENEDERRRLYDIVYGCEKWNREIRPAMGDMLIREEVQVMLLEPTLRSSLQ